MLQVLLVDEFVAALELFFAEVEEGLRELGALHDGLVFGAQLQTSVDFRFQVGVCEIFTICFCLRQNLSHLFTIFYTRPRRRWISLL